MGGCSKANLFGIQPLVLQALDALALMDFDSRSMSDFMPNFIRPICVFLIGIHA